MAPPKRKRTRGMCSRCPHEYRLVGGVVQKHVSRARREVVRCEGSGLPPRDVPLHSPGYKIRETEGGGWARRRARLWCLDCRRSVYCERNSDLLESHDPRTGKFSVENRCQGSHLPGRVSLPRRTKRDD